jgi:hypothetical protein
MAKRAKRAAWRLVVGLVVVLVGGSVTLFADCQSRLPEEKKWLVLLPRDRWGFGRLLVASHSPRPKVDPFRVGSFGVRVK